MKTEIDSKCIQDFMDKVEKLGRKGAKLENKALLEGAEVINKEIINNAPVRKKNSNNSKEKIKLSKVTKEKGMKIVKIGIQKEDNSEAFYLKFYEWGTIKQVARPFMRPAFEKKRKEGVEKMAEVIREGLKE